MSSQPWGKLKVFDLWVNKVSTSALAFDDCTRLSRSTAQVIEDLGLLCAQVAVSTVTESERLLFRKLHYPGIYRCVARYGYGDRVRMDTKFVIKLLDKASPRQSWLPVLLPHCLQTANTYQKYHPHSC